MSTATWLCGDCPDGWLSRAVPELPCQTLKTVIQTTPLPLFPLYVASLPPVVQWSDRRGQGNYERGYFTSIGPCFGQCADSDTFEDAFDWYSDHVWGIVYGSGYDDNID